MFCGKWGASQCSGERLFDYLGDYLGNEHTPMQINYHYTGPNTTALEAPKGIVPFDKETQLCSKGMYVSNLKFGAI